MLSLKLCYIMFFVVVSSRALSLYLVLALCCYILLYSATLRDIMLDYALLCYLMLYCTCSVIVIVVMSLFQSRYQMRANNKIAIIFGLWGSMLSEVSFAFTMSNVVLLLVFVVSCLLCLFVLVFRSCGCSCCCCDC